MKRVLTKWSDTFRWLELDNTLGMSNITHKDEITVSRFYVYLFFLLSCVRKGSTVEYKMLDFTQTLRCTLPVSDVEKEDFTFKISNVTKEWMKCIFLQLSRYPSLVAEWRSWSSRFSGSLFIHYHFYIHFTYITFLYSLVNLYAVYCYERG